jgi:hypothetical protein
VSGLYVANASPKTGAGGGMLVQIGRNPALGAIAVLAFGSPAWSQTQPDNVLTPYRNDLAATNRGDFAGAEAPAKEALAASEGQKGSARQF